MCTIIQFSCSVMSNSSQPHGLQQTRPPCPSPTPTAYSNSCPLSQWCHPTMSSSVVPFSSCLQSFPSSEPLPVSQLFASGGQRIGASASVLPMNIQGWFPLGWTGWIFLLSKGLSGIFCSTSISDIQIRKLERQSNLISPARDTAGKWPSLGSISGIGLSSWCSEP